MMIMDEWIKSNKMKYEKKNMKEEERNDLFSTSWRWCDIVSSSGTRPQRPPNQTLFGTRRSG